jgi:hypothetical protein
MSWITDNVEEPIASYMMKLVIDLPNKTTVERDFTADVDIDYEMLVEQLTQIPSVYAFWSQILAECKKQVAVIDRMLVVKRGKLLREFNEEARKTNTKTRREDVEDLIEVDEELNRLEVKKISAERQVSKLFAIVRALEMKAECMRSLSGFKKQEQRDP